MTNLFEVIDKSGRKIHLTKERWRHIQEEHPRINDLEILKTALKIPQKITLSKYSPKDVRYYYTFNKKLKRYLFVAVRCLKSKAF